MIRLIQPLARVRPSWPDAGRPFAVIIDLQELLGPQPRTGYVDVTGTPTGEYECAACGRAVMVAHHHTRPDGTRPVILDAETHPRGPWRVTRRKSGPAPLVAVFTSADDVTARRWNHRIICPAARI